MVRWPVIPPLFGCPGRRSSRTQEVGEVGEAEEGEEEEEEPEVEAEVEEEMEVEEEEEKAAVAPPLNLGEMVTNHHLVAPSWWPWRCGLWPGL